MRRGFDGRQLAALLAAWMIACPAAETPERHPSSPGSHPSNPPSVEVRPVDASSPKPPSLPESASRISGLRYPPGALLSPLSLPVIENLHAIRQKAPGRHEERFIKVGGSGTSTHLFLTCLDRGRIDWGDWSSLKPTRSRFAQSRFEGECSFSRKSQAARPGGTASWALTGQPSPLQQEIDHVNPRFALVHFGTNDMLQGRHIVSATHRFFHQLTTLLDTLTSQGVIPVLTSVAPREDHPRANAWVGSYNALLKALAAQRRIPFLDLHTAFLSLPGRGRAEDKLHGNVYREGDVVAPCVFTEAGLAHAYNVRNLLTLRALHACTSALRPDPGPRSEPVYLAGRGGASRPWVIPELPFGFVGDTSLATHMSRPTPHSCAGGPPLDGLAHGGPEHEFIYTPRRTEHVRALVLNGRRSHVDLFLLEDLGAKGTACLAHGERTLSRVLIAGTTYRFVLDTRTVGGTPRWGEVGLVIARCRPGDRFCD